MTEIIIALLSALTGGGLTAIITWRATRRKAEGEAAQTEADAMKSIQDVYQQALEDQQKYIAILQDTRDHLVNDREEMRRENMDLRKRLNDMDEKMRQLERDVDNNRKMMASMKHLLCGRLACQQRTNVDISNTDFCPDIESADTAKKKRTRKSQKE